MNRSIEMCGAVALCVAVTACSSLPPPEVETRETGILEPDSESASVAAPPVQPELPLTAEDQPRHQARRGSRHENLTCYTGNDDRHARIGVELLNGEVNYFAFYSKSRPRTCSIDAGRGDARSRWSDEGAYSTVTLPGHRGKLRIERRGSAYRFAFFDVDRVRYCGMTGKINGSLTVTRGKSSCEVQGVMDGHAL